MLWIVFYHFHFIFGLYSLCILFEKCYFISIWFLSFISMTDSSMYGSLCAKQMFYYKNFLIAWIESRIRRRRRRKAAKCWWTITSRKSKNKKQRIVCVGDYRKYHLNCQMQKGSNTEWDMHKKKEDNSNRREKQNENEKTNPKRNCNRIFWLCVIFIFCTLYIFIVNGTSVLYNCFVGIVA